MNEKQKETMTIWKILIVDDHRSKNGWVRLSTVTPTTRRHFEANAKVYNLPDGIGADYMGYGVREGSRVSKLSIRDFDHYPPLEVYNWDRGLDFDQAPEGLIDAIVDFCDALPKL